MTHYEAALQVLKSARRPLTIREITQRAIERGLLTSRSKTPHASMSAALYTRLGKDPRLVKLETPTKARALRGSVRWTLRETTPNTSISNHQ
jgi:hypothetical protein